VYAYAFDGQEATSIMSGFQSNPIVSNIAAYAFFVALVPVPPLPSGALRTVIN